MPIKITRVLQGPRNAAIALFHQHLGESLFKALVLRTITEARILSTVGSHSTYETILARKCPSLDGLRLQICLLDQLIHFHSVPQLHSMLSTTRLKDIALSCSPICHLVSGAHSGITNILDEESVKPIQRLFLSHCTLIAFFVNTIRNDIVSIKANSNSIECYECWNYVLSLA